MYNCATNMHSTEGLKPSVRPVPHVERVNSPSAQGSELFVRTVEGGQSNFKRKVNRRVHRDIQELPERIGSSAAQSAVLPPGMHYADPFRKLAVRDGSRARP